MDRYNDVKILLKKWEQAFVEQQQRKPNKEDIDNAPEDTRKLYKEYRSLKQAKEISDSNSGPTGQARAAVEDSGSWGSHLNRSSLPVATPSLTAQDRENLQASAQYYGMKLKSNLASFSKERPVSLRKSLTPGRTPLKSWKDRLTEQPNSPAATTTPSATPPTTPSLTVAGLVLTNHFTPRRTSNISRGSHLYTSPLDTSPLVTQEPQELFEAFKAPHTSCEESSDARNNSDASVRSVECSNGNDMSCSAVAFTPATSAGSAHTPSPKIKMRTSGTATGASGRLNGSVGNSGGLKRQGHSLGSLLGGGADEDAGALAGFAEKPGGVRGGPATRGRPSLLSRLSSVDRGWLERCQVFGEVEEGDKPVAGNKDSIPEGSGDQNDDDGGGGGGMRGIKVRREEKEEDGEKIRDSRAKKGGKKVMKDGVKEAVGAEGSGATAAAELALRSSRRGRGGKAGRTLEGEAEQMSQASEAPDEDQKEALVEAKKTSKRGRKRRREADDVGSEEVGAGAPTKRKRSAKKQEEGTEVEATPVQKEGKKKMKRVKKEEEEEEEEENLKTKAPEKPPQENLLGEVDDDVRTTRTYNTQPASGRKNSDGNFVKINLKKKSHVKGYALRGAGLRKQMYMQKFQLKGERFGGGAGLFGRGRRGGFRGGFNRQGDTCFKCGGTGHWAKDCRGPALPTPVVDNEPAVEEPFELPTLEEVARATGTLRCQAQATPPIGQNEEHSKQDGANGKQSDDALLNVIRPDYERPVAPPPMEPLYSQGEDGKVQATPDEVYAALGELGYQSFRPGQEDAIMRILSGLSTLVVLSTGMGKSLCYQLPAYLYAQRSSCITLVISPLVSLMDDQLSGLPAKLKAACIHSNMTMKQREAAIEKVKLGQVCLLLLSPEALVGGGGSGSGCLPPAHQLPPVAFACIDEAHCVSEWSHNFRPCYLRLCKVLRDRLGVSCLLGLTATATLSTALDIAHHLNIHHQDGIAVRSAAVPPNLGLSVSMDRDKDQALVSLLKGDRFGCLDSIIVYCTRREETVRVAALLRTCLQGVLVKERSSGGSSTQAQHNPIAQKKKDLARKKIRKPLKWQAEAYHAGLSAAERRRVQNNFMCGELRVTVATVAFGMGLDKSDVRGIVHYNMPKSFESYVQEIGRAGRDGEPAHCHLFLDPEGGDLHELRRHIYADTVDYYTVKRLVQKVFPPCKCRQIHQKQQNLECEDDIEDAALLEMMDICDQESSVNPPGQPSMVQPTEAVEHRDVPSPSSAEMLPTPEEEEEKEEEVREPLGGNDPTKPLETKPATGDDDWRNNREAESNWPTERVCHTHERAIPIQDTVESLDITEQGVETLLCYLELHPQRFVELLHPTLSACKVSCYDGPRQLQKTTKICPPVAVVLARKRMAGERVETCDWLEFDVVEVADTMGWQLSLVKRGLRQLQWSTTDRGGRSGILVEFSSLSFYFRSYGDLNDEEMDRVCQFLHQRVQTQERTQLYQLSACFKAFQSVGYRSVSSCVDDLDEARSLQLKDMLSDYFDKKRDRDQLQTLQDEELNKYKLLDWEDQIRADIRSFLSNRSDEKFSGRAVARIFHGIGSPCYPATTYGRDRRYWRKYIQFDFNQLIRWATQEIIRFK